MRLTSTRSICRLARQFYPTQQAGIHSYFALIRPEVAGLPGYYGTPSGRLPIAEAIAWLWAWSPCATSERVFVDTAAQGNGVGRLLAQVHIAEARRAGYELMRLDTIHGRDAAIRLYSSLGFQQVEP